MSSPLRITTAKRNAATAAQLAILGRRTFHEAFAAQNKPEDMAEYLEQTFSPDKQLAELQAPNSFFFLAMMQQEVVGYAKLIIPSALGAEPGTDVSTRAEIQRLYVLEDWIGTGLGAALMRRCIEEARERGCRSVVLGVWEKNERAIEFYRRFGFKHIGGIDFKLGQDVQHDLILRKGL
ncbi:GNAT family N-acetyltransferase [Hymenobacter latericus]|uniref:GNAT family N-acetyltransferase n=1 Tax=Hymenobacter sp. YIM 151858-1 TaxID=2987688 RepID=UPI002226A98B|nr:GNAT family N-acetyltransferase [Hymenobacter sp. YIM 151858-1]UYZ58857.1 GNAT family N-acetyltransferase [Hymenobacter sp. YIM 151858-1]